MSWKNTEERYGSLSISLHWLMLLLIAVTYACIEFRGIFPKDSPGRALIKDMHFMLGLTVFVLVWLRLALRLFGPTPRIEPKPSGWQMLLAHLMHWGLYALMIGMPIAGWMILSAADKPVPFYGFELPPLIGANDDLAEEIEGWHALGGTIGYWLIGLHAIAGLYHHYVVRDNSLLRILPKR
ncbi:cytochrome b [Pseudomonas akapageensis]|uniref:cytochrome b n=1 Tax=Pseudomonas akapageensis TaxID=2609961 RepID=UPI0014094882|nr:cytochrome b [Pseudomonas akapageensis]